MNSSSNLNTYFVTFFKNGDDNSNAITAFKTTLPHFLKQQNLTEDAVKIQKEYTRFGFVLVACTPEVSELLKQMPGVASVSPNGTKHGS